MGSFFVGQKNSWDIRGVGEWVLSIICEGDYSRLFGGWEITDYREATEITSRYGTERPAGQDQALAGGVNRVPFGTKEH